MSINTEHYRELLLNQAKRLNKDFNIMKKYDVSEQDKYSPTELSNYDNHPADLGTDLFQVEMNQALKVHQKHQLYEVEAALQRIEDGDYGICKVCGKEIAEERLEALPTAKNCIECEHEFKIERDMIRKGRPIEEAVIGFPFGRKRLYKREDDEYEGLDQLNDLIKYGSADTPQDMGGYEDYEEYYTNEIDRQGVVDKMDLISNEQYRRQLP